MNLNIVRILIMTLCLKKSSPYTNAYRQVIENKKNPTKARFVIAALTCYTKPLSKYVTSVFN